MPDDCPALIDALMPAAMPALAGLLVASAEDLCLDIAGVC
jgi:hypothetical protein